MDGLETRVGIPSGSSILVVPAVELAREEPRRRTEASEADGCRVQGVKIYQTGDEIIGCRCPHRRRHGCGLPTGPKDVTLDEVGDDEWSTEDGEVGATRDWAWNGDGRMLIQGGDDPELPGDIVRPRKQFSVGRASQRQASARFGSDPKGQVRLSRGDQFRFDGRGL